MKRRSSMPELDLDEIARGKYNFDIAGHYARPDIFRLTDERGTPATCQLGVPSAIRSITASARGGRLELQRPLGHRILRLLAPTHRVGVPGVALGRLVSFHPRVSSFVRKL